MADDDRTDRTSGGKRTPRLYGGTERVVSWLCEELVRQGHEVTLFASGDSVTSARLYPVCSKALRLAGIEDHLASHLVMLDQVRRLADDFDLIHFQSDLIQFPLFRDIDSKTVTTLHGRIDLADAHPVYRAFPELPHKRPDRAIEIAKRAGLPLRITAKVAEADGADFNELIKRMPVHPTDPVRRRDRRPREARYLGKDPRCPFPDRLVRTLRSTFHRMRCGSGIDVFLSTRRTGNRRKCIGLPSRSRTRCWRSSTVET